MTDERVVGWVSSNGLSYGPLATAEIAPELSGGVVRTVSALTLRRALRALCLDWERYGQTDWNPLGDWIPANSKVVIKPNLVLEENLSGEGWECLITHPEVIDAVLEYVCLANPAEVIVGDAPLQGCNFDLLTRKTGLTGIIEKYRLRGMRISLVDFRRTIATGTNGTENFQQLEEQRGKDHFVLYDLGADSLLETEGSSRNPFRVTMYDPRRLEQTHGHGRHQYLVAKEVIDADVVINLPKLKTHMKAGLTGALKNLVGINGNKEYLPHHRKGGSDQGGDCYEGYSVWKHLAEEIFDFINQRPGGKVYSYGYELGRQVLRIAQKTNGDGYVEGAWHGNGTVWRMCLDLQRILHYGLPSGALSRDRQRRVFHITDAIVGGDLEGPLRVAPVSSRFLTVGTNAAAVEWVNALAMGWEPSRIPLIRQSFENYPYPLTDFEYSEIQLRGDATTLQEVVPRPGAAFRPSLGWRGHVERRQEVNR